MSSSTSTYKVAAKAFNKSLVVPTSKSFANRALIIAALDPRPVTIKHLPESTDVVQMLACLKQIGLKIEQAGDQLTIVNSFPECENFKDQNPVVLETGDGGTTNRFIAAFLARGKKRYQLKPMGHMQNRPMEDIEDSLKLLGVKISKSENCWLEIQGPIQADKLANLKVNAKKSTQFVSALAMACADMNVQVEPDQMEASQSYYAMTLDLIAQWKSGKKNFIVPVDFSSMSYPLALGATLGQVQVENCLAIDQFQADSCLLEILKHMGAAWNIDNQGLNLKAPQTLKALDWDCSGCPDLVPTLAYLCAQAQGESHLLKLEVLKHKESDRIAEIIRILEAFQVQYSYDEKAYSLTISGPSKKASAVEFHPPADHRMVMTTYMFMRKNSGGRVSNAGHVSKSFPAFFEIMD